MAAELLVALLPLATADTAKLLQEEFDLTQKQNPTLDPFELMNKALTILISDSKSSDTTKQELRNLALANHVAKTSNCNISLMTAVFHSPEANNIREFAQNFDTSTIQTLAGGQAQQLAQAVRTETFNAQPTATVQGMIDRDKIRLSTTDPVIKADVIGVLSKLNDTFISNSPISAVTTIAPEAVKDVPSERLPIVMHELGAISRMQAISPTTTMMEHLASTGLTSALAIAQIPKSNFVDSVIETSHGAVSAPVAALSHNTATAIVRRNESIFMDLLLNARGTGLKAIDGEDIDRKLVIRKQIRQQGLNLNIENLFGSNECICDECTSVYSAASYLVDLLVYLRNSNLSPTLNPNTSSSGKADDISGTVLEKLFRRRPDLGNIELNCENTNAIVPYIDLANEVMESFVVNLGSYDRGSVSGAPTFSQADINSYNISEYQNFADLLSQPQNVNYEAYRTLASSVYPFNIPYHLPIATIRAFLQYLRVSRGDLLDYARRKPPSNSMPSSIQAEIEHLQDIALDRQVSAEYLGLIQEEYIALTKEAFFTDEWFRTTQNLGSELSNDEYRTKIGVRQVYEYWGYHDAESMMSTTTGGLCFVKNQLLPRSGLSWVELTQVVQTSFVNPSFPKGRAKAIFDQLRYSYRFLQTLVDSSQMDPQRRFGKLVKYLVQAQIINIANLVLGRLQTNQPEGASQYALHDNDALSDAPNDSLEDPRSSNEVCCTDAREVSDWVIANFENMGKIIVLEFGEGPFLSDNQAPPGGLTGDVFAKPKSASVTTDALSRLKKFPNGSIGSLNSDGRIVGPNGELIATVTIGSTVMMNNGGQLLDSAFPDYNFSVQSGQDNVAFIIDGFLKLPIPHCSSRSELQPVKWMLNEHQGSGCNIDNVRLQHLDGTNLDETEWDRMHRFIRLWRTLGWSASEVDRAVVAMSFPVWGNQTTRDLTSNSALLDGFNGTTKWYMEVDDFFISFDDYTNSNSSSKPPKDSTGNNSDNYSNGFRTIEITPFLIEQLSALVRTLSLVSISLEQLLCLWTDIPTIAVIPDNSTTSGKSLFEKLFFTGNLKKTDPVFGLDANGNYFTGRIQKISGNLPVIMAALRLKADEILYLLGLSPDLPSMRSKTPIEDVLNIANLSKIYRIALMSRILGIDIYDINAALQGFGPAFRSAKDFLLFIQWWNTVESIQFPWEELRYIIDDIEAPNDPLVPSATSILATAKAINDQIEEIKSKYLTPTDPDKEYLECADDVVKGHLEMLFDDVTAAQVIRLLDGTTKFKATKAPKVPDVKDGDGHTFADKVAMVSSGKLTYSILNDGTVNLYCRGILTAAEMDLAKELVHDIVEALVGTKIKDARNEMSQTVTETKDMWLQALDSLSIQSRSMFNDIFNGVFDKNNVLSGTNSHMETLLAGDIPEKSTTSSPNGKMPSEKRFCFMQLFVPYLRSVLVHKSVADAVIAAVGFNDLKLAKTVLENVMIGEGGDKNAIDYLLQLLTPPSNDRGNFDGYITVPADDFYTFLYPNESESTPAAMTLDGINLEWSVYQDIPKRYWTTDQSGFALKAGKLYPIIMKNINLSILEWRPKAKYRSLIPALSFMPRIALDKSLEVFDRLKKTAILVNQFKLSSDEIIYMKEHKEDFDGMDFSSLSMAQWKRMQAYIALRDSLKSPILPLIDLFNWCTHNSSTGGTKLVSQISKSTSWKQADIEAIITLARFSGGTANDFKNEKILVKCSNIIALSTKLGVDIPRLFNWSAPLGTSSKDFLKFWDISEDIKQVARSKFDVESWNNAVRPINDVLRQQQNKSLISYLLVQDEIRNQGIIDADSLFEFFLIDVQMTPAVETSRIKQAIATVQVFIQRCFLGLEKCIEPSQLDRKRWDWMGRYRLWEANRKVFLYPENWIDPSLRDDKSPFFMKLESEMLQKDLAPDIVTSAVKSFLYSVNEIAKMEITSLCVEKYGQPMVSTETGQQSHKLDASTDTTLTTNPDTIAALTTSTSGVGDPMAPTTSTQHTRIHLFARTTTSPFSYFYISYSMGNWTPWSKMDIEIPYHTVHKMPVEDVGGNRYMTVGKDAGVGTYMSPIVYGGRLLVFIPEITKKTNPNPNQIGKKSRDLADQEIQQLQAIEQWEIKMSYTEFQNRKWTQRKTCPEGVLVENERVSWDSTIKAGPPSFIFPIDKSIMPAIESFSFVAAEIITADPTFDSKDPSASPPKVSLGVRVIASRLLLPGIHPPYEAVLNGIGEWDFVDEKLDFVGESKGFNKSGPAPTIFARDTTENFTTNFHYQVGSTSESTILHSLTATDDRSICLGPRLDSYAVTPTVAKGRVASHIDNNFSAEAKAIIIRKEAGSFNTQLLYHKFIHPLIAAASVEGPEEMPLLPLYTYLSSLNDVTRPSGSPVTDSKIDSSGNPLPAHGSITDLIPPISDIHEAFGGILSRDTYSFVSVFNERSTPFSIYNWEIGLHAPMVLVDRLLKTQQFEQALNVCHYVFNPLVQGDKVDIKKCWIFAPFKKLVTQTTEEMFLNYKAGLSRQDVTDWRNNPFKPHVVARSRPQAYMMWMVMKYIEILIAYGDYYFRQNTLETIPDAIQLYILASHLYGPRGQKIPRQGPKRKYTYNQLATKFDAFSNAMVQLEEAFPFSNQTSLPVGKLPDDTSAPLANVFGFAGTLLFAIPDNPNLRALGDIINDRLFKIRHSRDINGLFRKLPLFEPPLDPTLMVQATAQGISIDSVLQDLNGPMPNYRFQYLLSRALELAQEVKSFGNSLLVTREKVDFENMSLLRAKHDTSSQTLLMDIKKLSLDESNKSLEALQYARNAPVCRLRFYLQQIGVDESGIPKIDKDFSELNAKIEKPISEGGLQLMPSEKEEMDLYSTSADLSTEVGILEAIGAGMNLLPTIGGNCEPLGVGISIFAGGSNIAACFEAKARVVSMDVSHASYQAGVAGRKSQAMRALQDRIIQANMAGHEIVSIDKQVTIGKIRAALASKEVDNQQKQIDQMHEIEDFLRQKYSNKELYSWMEGATRSLFYKTYTQAYDLAKKAEKAFQFERPFLKSMSFIGNGYWDPTRDGLMAGEHLFNALKQLEAKYIENRGYDYEITKFISLRQLDPMQLINLRKTGVCNFNIPEVLFDMDFPGHYMRRLKSVSISVPCIVGPYTSVNSTLRLVNHKIRFQPTKASGDNYLENITDSDERFTTSNVPITSIAICNGQNDTGTFELSFHDDRYLPFEGAGAISSWNFALPQQLDRKFRQFNWDSITDVIITLRYTSLDGGSQMTDGAQLSVKRYLEAVDYVGTSGGLWGIFDLTNEFSTEWAKFVADQAATRVESQPAVFSLPSLNEKLPVFASCRSQGGVLATNVYILSDVPFPGKGLNLLADGKRVSGLALANVKDVPTEMKCYSLNDGTGVPVGNWTIQLDSSSVGSSVGLKRAWLLFRYILK